MTDAENDLDLGYSDPAHAEHFDISVEICANTAI